MAGCALLQRLLVAGDARIVTRDASGTIPYWHMVSKLALAIQERFFAALDAGAGLASLRALGAAYYRVRDGLGGSKSVAEFGTFPTDPHSHTPPDGQARQPGMTGQVKEDILTRRGELGVRVVAGCLRFQPALLRHRELLPAACRWHTMDLDGIEHAVALPAGGLGFTVCQVPVVYHVTDAAPATTLSTASGEHRTEDGLALSRADSAHVFGRSGAITRIDVTIPSTTLLLEPTS